jgi:hypothetical protein
MTETFVKFNTFAEAVAEGLHDLGADTLKVALTNTAPTPATDTVLDTVTKHPAPLNANGYAQQTPEITSSGQTAGVYKLVLGDVVFTASGGTLGPFRYAILFNSSESNRLIGYWDYGASITLNDGETFTCNADPTTGVLTLT